MNCAETAIRQSSDSEPIRITIPISYVSRLSFFLLVFNSVKLIQRGEILPLIYPQTVLLTLIARQRGSKLETRASICKRLALLSL